jgi:hypothetical protein
MIHAGQTVTVVAEDGQFRVVAGAETIAVVPRTTTREVHRYESYPGRQATYELAFDSHKTRKITNLGWCQGSSEVRQPGDQHRGTNTGGPTPGDQHRGTNTGGPTPGDQHRGTNRGPTGDRPGTDSDCDCTGATSPARASRERTSPAQTSPARTSPTRPSQTRTITKCASRTRTSPARTSPVSGGPRIRHFRRAGS